jgi:hypothetical protein
MSFTQQARAGTNYGWNTLKVDFLQHPGVKAGGGVSPSSPPPGGAESISQGGGRGISHLSTSSRHAAHFSKFFGFENFQIFTLLGGFK